MSEQFSFKLVTPEKTFMEGDASMIVLPGIEGDMGILADHSNIITSMRPGLIKVIGTNEEKLFFVEEGFIKFSNNELLVVAVGLDENEKINILNAILFAMETAIKKLKKKPKLILVDGNKTPNLKNYKLQSVIKGDQKIPSISAASIIAKVTRDKMISRLGKKFKNYYWSKNYGYGTKQHLKAIKKFGITSHHRRTFSPISKLK